MLRFLRLLNQIGAEESKEKKDILLLIINQSHDIIIIEINQWD
jgi:hypothetical protein